MDWFENWFNTKYYHILYKNRDEKEAENFIKNLLNTYKFPENAYLLDLACGKGRHARIISEFGYKVLGLDLSEESISFARENYNKSNLYFDVSDMRIPYSQTEIFDGIFNLFTSFGYFEDENDNYKVLKSIHKQLKPKGLFFFDFLNCKPILKKLPKEEIKLIDGIEFRIKKMIVKNKIVKNISFTDLGKEYLFNEKLELITFNQILHLAKKTNFKLIKTYGDYSLNQFEENTSSRMILVFEKISS